MDLTVIVGTFGDLKWSNLAHERAIPSAELQAPVVHVHGDVLETYGESLAQCRNRGAEQAKTEWLCFLDSDDEILPGFVDAMSRAPGDLRTPAIEYVRAGRIRPAIFWPDRDLREGNWLVVSTLMRRELFLDIGGFRDVPMYEDWDLFMRCTKTGATISKVPDAVTRVHINLKSLHRNGSTRRQKIDAHNHVLRLNYPELVDAG